MTDLITITAIAINVYGYRNDGIASCIPPATVAKPRLRQCIRKLYHIKQKDQDLHKNKYPGLNARFGVIGRVQPIHSRRGRTRRWEGRRKSCLRSWQMSEWGLELWDVRDVVWISSQWVAMRIKPLYICEQTRIPSTSKKFAARLEALATQGAVKTRMGTYSAKPPTTSKIEQASWGGAVDALVVHNARLGDETLPMLTLVWSWQSGEANRRHRLERVIRGNYRRKKSPNGNHERVFDCDRSKWACLLCWCLPPIQRVSIRQTPSNAGSGNQKSFAEDIHY